MIRGGGGTTKWQHCYYCISILNNQPEDKLHVKLYNETVYVSSLPKKVLEIAKISASDIYIYIQA